MIAAVERTVEVTVAASRPRVLVALSGPEAPRPAIEAGRVIAAALGASLHGLLAWPTAIRPAEVARLLSVPPEVLEDVVLHVEVGDPADQICAAARSLPVALVVLVAELGGCDTCGLGDLAARTLAGMEGSALVVRPGTRLGPIRRILVPVDGTPSTATALAPAGELAQRTGAAVDVVMLDDAATPPSAEPGAMAPPQYVDQPQHEWPAFSAELLQRLCSAIARWPPGVPTRLLLGAGPPAAGILRFAGELDPDVIALVWHGTAGHGSVFNAVLRGTRRPVLVLRCSGAA